MILGEKTAINSLEQEVTKIKADRERSLTLPGEISKKEKLINELERHGVREKSEFEHTKLLLEKYEKEDLFFDGRANRKSPAMIRKESKEELQRISYELSELEKTPPTREIEEKLSQLKKDKKGAEFRLNKHENEYVEKKEWHRKASETWNIKKTSLQTERRALEDLKTEYRSLLTKSEYDNAIKNKETLLKDGRQKLNDLERQTPKLERQISKAKKELLKTEKRIVQMENILSRGSINKRLKAILGDGKMEAVLIIGIVVGSALMTDATFNSDGAIDVTEQEKAELESLVNQIESELISLRTELRP